MFSVVQSRKTSWTGALATGGTFRPSRSSTVNYLCQKEPERAKARREEAKLKNEQS